MNRKLTVPAVFFTGLLLVYYCLFTVERETPPDVEFPPYYDLRELNRLTPVKAINFYGGFPAYSAYAGLESLLVPAESRNFYEWSLHVHQRERFDHLNRRPGTFPMAVACLASWSGPEDHPETGYTYWSTGGPGVVQEHIQQVVYLPERKEPLDNNTVKRFIMEYGPLYAEMDGFIDLFFDEDYNSYYHFGHFGGPEEWPFFAVAIVGWDEDFNKEHFKEPAPGDGAFIAKASLGNQFGENGYFYISYYDTELKIKASFNNAEDVTNYGDIYQYDPLGPTSAAGNGSTVYWGANVFTSRRGTPLEAVSFYTNDVQVHYGIFIYRNVTGGSPVDGSPAAAKTGMLIYPGYYTVKLDTPVPLEQDESFSVVIRFENAGRDSPVPIEACIPDYSSQAAANGGESFISSDGRLWQDLTLSHPGANVCIKAFTAYVPTAPPPVISFELRKVTQNMWLFSKTFGVIDFTIENFSEIPIHEIILYRKRNDGHYQHRRTISPNRLKNGSFTYIEDDLPSRQTFTYHIAVFDVDGRITGKSNEASMRIGE
ncbi:MAG: hypothetical protein GY950_07450 [bacterium]|nr:hypothetical protein [bacterium]